MLWPAGGLTQAPARLYCAGIFGYRTAGGTQRPHARTTNGDRTDAGRDPQAGARPVGDRRR